MLHDLHSGRTGSKAVGAAWVKETLDPEWAGLIDRSWSGRPNPAISVRTAADPEEFMRTLAFLQYIIEESNQYYDDEQSDKAAGR